MSIRVMLADDHKILREALKFALEQEADICCVGEAGNGIEALKLADELRPDVVVMDIDMPDMGGIQATLAIQEKCAGIKVLALSTFLDRRIVLQMLGAGARGYIAKSAGRDELLRGIRAVAEGVSYLSPEVSQIVINSACGSNRQRGKGNNYRLGRRETEVLQLLAEGLTSPAIGEHLHIATSTVEVHRRNIMSKLDLHNIAELTKYAIRQGLTEIGPRVTALPSSM